MGFMVQWSGVVLYLRVTESPSVHQSDVRSLWLVATCYFLLSQGVISNFSDFGAADHDIVHEQPGRVRIYTGRNLVFTCLRFRSIRFSKVNMNHCRFQRTIRYQSIERVDSLRWVRLKWSWNLWGTAVSNVQRDQQSSISCSTDPAKRETAVLRISEFWDATSVCVTSYEGAEQWTLWISVNHLTILVTMKNIKRPANQQLQ